jgi:Tfp pilus assembly protein PilP
VRRCRLAALAGGLLLGACGQADLSDLREFVERSGEPMRGRVDPIPRAVAVEPVRYEGTAGRRQPFDPARVRVGDHPRGPNSKHGR